MDSGVRAWREHEDSCVAALNSIVGQRLEIRRLRSRRREADFLAEPLRNAGIGRPALEALLGEVRGFKARARGVRLLLARAHGEPTVHPRDVLDLPPDMGPASEAKIPFSKAIKLVEEGFASIHPEMGAFVRLMADRRWIDCRNGERRAAGNYCWLFMKSRTPRVFYNPSGTIYDVNGLAHEIGHAFSLQFYGGKGLPFGAWSGCAAVAEMPSGLAELAVRDAMFSSMPEPADRLRTAWLDMVTVVMDLLHQPALFELETAVHELRQKGLLTASLLKDAEARVWDDWYGDILSAKSETFWMDEISYDANECFWSMVYTFGTLLAVGMLAQKDRLGDRFYRAYVDFLSDFGRMTVEELVRKHFDADLSRPEFWRSSLGLVEARIDRFEKIIGTICPRSHD